jgi:signal transduction histidine kinase
MNLDLRSAPQGLQAIYMPWMRTAGAVYVNGTQVGQGGSFGTWESARPQWFAVPGPMLQAGANRIEVRLWVSPGRAGHLSPVLVGDPDVLRAHYEQRLFWQVTGPELIFVLSLLIGLFMGLVWLQRRHDAIFGSYALVGFGFALMVPYEFVLNPPLPIEKWNALVNIGGWTVIIFTTHFVIRYGGWRWPRIERSLLWLLAGITLLEVMKSTGYWLIDYWMFIFVPVCSFQVSLFFFLAWKRRRIQDVLLAIAAPWCLISTLWESYFSFPVEWFSLSDYTFLPHFAVMGWIQVQRFANSLNESEQLNAELEQRVAQKHAELQANFRRLQFLEREQAVVEERSRIMSDMHDGIGAQLISTIGLAEHGKLSQQEMATALRECLDDLRLTIDSLEPSDNDLLPALGNFRYRVDHRLKKQGITLDWRVEEIPKLANLTPRNLLHVLRILQEAFTNVLKHAHASMIRVETGLREGGQQVFIRVSDNGAGFQGDHRGRGLTNMQQRAERIGGLLQVAPSSSGTTLELLLPVA